MLQRFRNFGDYHTV